MLKAEASLITDGGFETPFTPSARPTTFGIWDGDAATSVMAMAGVTPFEGSRMAHFLASTPTGPSGDFTASNLWQLIDLAPVKSVTESGLAVGSASAWFNRVAGDSQTDTQFVLSLHAFAGAPTSFPSQVANNELALIRTNLFADGDTTTWEIASVDMPIPSNTDFLAVQIAAVENIFNDSVGIEFDGHFADAVSVDVLVIQ